MTAFPWLHHSYYGLDETNPVYHIGTCPLYYVSTHLSRANYGSNSKHSRLYCHASLWRVGGDLITVLPSADEPVFERRSAIVHLSGHRF